MLKQHFVLIGQMEEKEQKNLLKMLLNYVKKEKINLNFYMKSKTPLFKKIETIAKEIYNASEVVADTKVREQLKNFQENGYGEFPICA